jgi:hypothetical protein
MNELKEYRTAEQFQEILNSASNGNWSVAFKEAEEYGFYANDLIRANENAIEEGAYYFENLTDLALISEGAQKLRQ